MLWHSKVVVNWTFTSGGVVVHTYLFIDHLCIDVFIRILNFVIGLNHEIILTAKLFPIYCNMHFGKLGILCQKFLPHAHVQYVGVIGL